jgi:hypothetical protein
VVKSPAATAVSTMSVSAAMAVPGVVPDDPDIAVVDDEARAVDDELEVVVLSLEQAPSVSARATAAAAAVEMRAGFEFMVVISSGGGRSSVPSLASAVRLHGPRVTSGSSRCD